MILKMQVYFFGAFGEERFEGGSVFHHIAGGLRQLRRQCPSGHRSVLFGFLFLIVNDLSMR